MQGKFCIARIITIPEIKRGAMNLTAGKKTMIKGGWIIAFNGKEHALLRDGVIVVEGNTVIHVGKDYSQPVDKVIDASSYVISPGFISVHAHMMNSPLNKSFFEDTGSRQFGMSALYDYGAVDSAATEDDFRLCGEFSAAEMMKTGTTTVVELNRQNAEIAHKIIGDSGMRGYVVPAFKSGAWYTPDGKKVHYKWNEEAGMKGLEYAVDFIGKVKNTYDGRIDSMLSPYQIDTCTPELFAAAKEQAEKLGVRLQVHAAQSLVEFREIMERYGMTPIEWLHDLGILNDNLIIGHCIFITGHSSVAYPGDRDLELLAESKAYVAHCPWVFARRSIILESLSRYLKLGIPVAMGTDTFPQDLINEMRIAAVASKIYDHDTVTATARQVFDAATLTGAKALNRDDLGKIAKGAKADMVFFKADTLRMSPLRDPIKNIVYNASGEDVDKVMVDGKFVVENGKAVNLDEERIVSQFQKALDRLWPQAEKYDRAGRSMEDLSPMSIPEWQE